MKLILLFTSFAVGFCTLTAATKQQPPTIASSLRDFFRKENLRVKIIEGLKGTDKQRKSANSFLRNRAAEFSEVLLDIIALPQKTAEDRILVAEAKHIRAALLELVSDSAKTTEVYRRLDSLANRLER